MTGQRRHRRRGQALVEFALIIPIFLLILLAIFDLGRGVFAYTSVTNAAREGARLAIVNQGAGLPEQRVRSQSSVAESDDADGTKITVKYVRADANGNPTATVCPAPVAIGCLANVTYATTFRPITPIVAQILFKNGVTLTATSIFPVEFTCPNAATSAANCPKQP
jgi:Flp pilus assembly protein TadG